MKLLNLIKSNKNLNIKWNSIKDEGSRNISKAIIINNIIEEIDLNAIFPKNIEYPNQNIIKNNITFNSQKNSIKKIEIDKELEINFPKSTSNKEFEIYSIILKGDYLIACGGNYVKIYHIKKSDFTVENEDTIIDKEDENYISLALSIISSDKIILAVGGKNSIIRLIDIIKIEEISRLIGHRNDINDLKFNPTKKNLLLSASADMSIRLWNVRNSIQIAIFGGDRCHLAQVLSIDWHISGDYFVSSGVDLRINIWDIRNVENLKICDDITSNNRQDYKIELINKPIYKCRNIHNTQIDSVTFNGNFILSKSSDGVIIEFMPCFNKEKDYFFLINTKSILRRTARTILYLHSFPECAASKQIFYEQVLLEARGIANH